MEREQTFKLKHHNVVLKIQITEKNIFTSWMHENKNEFTNKRTFFANQTKECFETLLPVLTITESIEVEKFIFNKKQDEQLSLF
jgi:hypothetical protein